MSEIAMPAAVDEFFASVREIVGPERLCTEGLDAYGLDGVAPEAAIHPRSAEDLARCLTEAHEASVAVVAIGGGGHLALGNVPMAYDAALCTRGLNRIIEYEPDDLTVTVEAGARLVDVEAALAVHGQRLPLDPPCGDGATVGGMLAAGASGPLRHAYGAPRDWLLGLRVAQSDGTICKAGGRVVKNVAGYDMGKLYVGSVGTLGVILEATLKVTPLPKAQATAVVGVDSAFGGSTLAFAMHDAGLALHSLELLSPPAANRVLGDARWSLLARAAGGQNAVERTLQDAYQFSQRVGGRFEIRETEQAWLAWGRAFQPGELTLRVSVQPSHVAEVMDALDRRYAGAAAQLSATVSAGLIRAQLHPSREARAGQLIDAAFEIAGRRAGSVVLEAAPLSIKRQRDVFGPLRPDFAIMRRLKEEFDPRRILAPGRFAGRL